MSRPSYCKECHGKLYESIIPFTDYAWLRCKSCGNSIGTVIRSERFDANIHYDPFKTDMSKIVHSESNCIFGSNCLQKEHFTPKE